MVTIADSSVRANVWETIYDLLNAYSFSTSLTKITSAYPDDDATFPMVVIHPVQNSKGEYSLGPRSAAVKTQAINVQIDLFTKKAKDIDVLGDEIHNAIEDDYPGITLVESDEDAVGTFETKNEQKVHMKSFMFSFIRR